MDLRLNPDPPRIQCQCSQWHGCSYKDPPIPSNHKRGCVVRVRSLVYELRREKVLVALAMFGQLQKPLHTDTTVAGKYIKVMIVSTFTAAASRVLLAASSPIFWFSSRACLARLSREYPFPRSRKLETYKPLVLVDRVAPLPHDAILLTT